MTITFHRAVVPVLASVLALAALSRAEDKPRKPDAVLKETVKEVKAGLGKNDVDKARAAFSRAEKIRGDFTDKKFAPLSKAIAGGVTHKNNEIAMLAIETLGRLKTPGSGKALSKLLNVPPKPAADKLELYKAAIAAAGAIHDPSTLKNMEKLLGHVHADIAVAAAEALGGYKALEPKPRLDLVKRLVKALDKQEKKAASAKAEEAKADATKVKDAIVAGLGKITGKEGLTTADEWSNYLKEEAKNA